jgi:membrane-associated protein
MRYRTFIVWNVAGAIIWAPGCVLLGYAFSTSLDTVGRTLTWAPFALIGIIVIGYVGMHLRRRRLERSDAAND